MGARWLVALGVGLAMVCLHPARAAGYCVTIPQGLNKSVSWKTIPVTYRVSDNLTDAAMLTAIDDAFKTWEAVACSTLKFTKGAQFKICTESDKTKCTNGTVHFEHGTAYIYVFWFDSTNKAAFPAAAGTSAYYNFLWFGMTAGIEGGSLAVNAFTYKWNAAGGDATNSILDLQNEMTTMAGSVIGLTDSKVATASMWPTMKFGDTSKRALDPDDIKGLTHLYLDKSNASCTAPPPPGADGCEGSAPSPDGQPTPGDGQPDGQPVTGDGQPVVTDAPVYTEAGMPIVDGTGSGCTSSADCPSGEVCTKEGVCVKTGGDDDGCGCRFGLPGRLPLPALLLALGMILGLFVLRRRR